MGAEEQALAGIAGEFGRAGVDRLVVSGVAWPDEPPTGIDGVSVQSLWLDASEQTRRRRLEQRGSSGEKLVQFLSAGTAEAKRVNPAWTRLDTDGLSEAETAERVRAHWGRAATDRVLWITGPRLAGASQIGWQIVSREWSDGRRAGFIDLAQLSFAWNSRANVGMANVAGLHSVFRDVDAERFVIVAPFDVEPAAVRAALPASDVSFVRLAPSVAERSAHAMLRRRGEGPLLAGDDVVGATDAALERILRVADAQSSLPHREHELIVDTRELSVVEAAAAVRSAAGW